MTNTHYLLIFIVTFALLMFLSGTSYFKDILNFKRIAVWGLAISAAFWLLMLTLDKYRRVLPPSLKRWINEADSYLRIEQHHIVFFSLLLVLFLFLKTIPTLSWILNIQLISIILGVVGALLFRPSSRPLIIIGLGFFTLAFGLYLVGVPFWAERATVYAYGFWGIGLFQMIKNKEFV